MGKVFSTRMLALHCPECGEPGYLTKLPAVRNSLSVRCKVYLQRLHSSSQIEIAATYPMRFEVRRVSSAIIDCRWDAPKWMKILQTCFPCFRSGNKQKPCIRTKVPGMLEVRATFARANAKPVVIWSEPYLWPPDKQVSRIKAVLLSKFGKERILQTHVEKGLSQRVGFTD
jgi:hypothetical protein